MDQIVYIINAVSTSIIVLAIAFGVVCTGIDKLQARKLASLKTITKDTMVAFCEEFGYRMDKPVSSNTVRQILQSLAEGHKPHMNYIKSIDEIFHKDKIDGRA